MSPGTYIQLFILFIFKDYSGLTKKIIPCQFIICQYNVPVGFLVVYCTIYTGIQAIPVTKAGFNCIPLEYRYIIITWKKNRTLILTVKMFFRLQYTYLNLQIKKRNYKKMPVKLVKKLNIFVSQFQIRKHTWMAGTFEYFLKLPRPPPPPPLHGLLAVFNANLRRFRSVV